MTGVVDTGSFTLVDVKSLSAHDVPVERTGQRVHGMTGSVDQFVATLSVLKVGAWEIRDISFFAADLKSIRDTQARFGLPAVDIVIGSDFLTLFEAQLSFRDASLVLNARG